MRFRPTRLEAATAIVGVTQLAIAGIVATHAPAAAVPMHFNHAGAVDRWGSPTDAALMIAFMAAVTLAAGAALSWKARKSDEGRRGLAWAQIVLLATTGIMTGLMVVLAGGVSEADAPRVSLVGLSLLFAVIGALLGKIAPNRLVGVRTPWNLASRLAWERSNRLAGRLLFWIGLAGLLIAPALPTDLGHRLVIGGVLLSAALSVFESWRVWRADPERIPL